MVVGSLRCAATNMLWVTHMPEASRFTRDVVCAAIALGTVASALIVGQIATYPHLATWYESLVKPPFTPPNWLFAPVWTLLYALMAFSFWRILILPTGAPGRGAALAAFFAQLALNAAWSWMFFAANNTLLGLIIIVPQLALVVLTILLFFRLDRIAAWFLVPLALWLGYAVVLNVMFWWLNP
jgi:tryptophan-rich sensory protein